MQSIAFTSLGSTLASRFPKPHTPIAFIYCADHALITETIEHFRKLEFPAIVLFYQQETQIVDDGDDLIYIELELENHNDFFMRLYPQISNLNSKWLYWGYNAEFLFFPFAETRRISDFTTFLVEEKRGSSFGLIVDAYTWEPSRDPLAINLDNVGIDTKNYYHEPASTEQFISTDPLILERIFDVRGGLRWRMMQHIPPHMKSLSRTPLIQISNDYKIDEFGKIDNPEIYTQHCKHHASPTCAVISFRLLLDLLHSPKSRQDAKNLQWAGGEQFRWTSPQLLRLGIMETGQWF